MSIKELLRPRGKSESARSQASCTSYSPNPCKRAASPPTLLLTTRTTRTTAAATTATTVTVTMTVTLTTICSTSSSCRPPVAVATSSRDVAAVLLRLLLPRGWPSALSPASSPETAASCLPLARPASWSGASCPCRRRHGEHHRRQRQKHRGRGLGKTGKQPLPTGATMRKTAPSSSSPMTPDTFAAVHGTIRCFRWDPWGLRGYFGGVVYHGSVAPKRNPSLRESALFYIHSSK